MNTLLIVVAIFLYSLQTVTLKKMNAQNLYSTIIVTSAFSAIITVFLFLINVNKGITVSSQTILWGILFGAISITILCCENMALQTGPMSYTVFFISASMVIPTIGGILLWKEPLTISIAAGLFLFLLSFYLILVAGKKENEKGNIKWVILCLITWLLNGCSSLVTKTHQTIMEGRESSELMMIGFAVAALLSATALLFIKKYHSAHSTQPIQSVRFTAKFFLLLLLTALGSGGGNVLTTFLAGRVPASLLFPFLLGGMTVATTLYSILFEKAKISNWGKLGLLVGITAITVINLA
jgi:drug/metabolite transporter (DMT)-like permease